MRSTHGPCRNLGTASLKRDIHSLTPRSILLLKTRTGIATCQSPELYSRGWCRGTGPRCERQPRSTGRALLCDVFRFERLDIKSFSYKTHYTCGWDGWASAHCRARKERNDVDRTEAATCLMKLDKLGLPWECKLRTSEFPCRLRSRPAVYT